MPLLMPLVSSSRCSAPSSSTRKPLTARVTTSAPKTSSSLRTDRYSRSCCQRRDAGEAIDWRLMTSVLGNVDLGGATVSAYLAKLAAEAITVVGAPGYARTIAEAARMRRVLETAQAAVARMTDGTVHNPAEYATHMIAQLDEVASAGLPSMPAGSRWGRASAACWLGSIKSERAWSPRGAPYGLPTLDADTLGMRPSQFIVLAGRPGMARTTVALHIALSAAKRAGSIGFFSLEMDAAELSERVLAALA